MVQGNSSRKFITLQGVEPKADVKVLLHQLTRLVIHVLHGHWGSDLECHPSTCMIAQQFVPISGQVTASEVLKQDLPQERWVRKRCFDPVTCIGIMLSMDPKFKKGASHVQLACVPMTEQCVHPMPPLLPLTKSFAEVAKMLPEAKHKLESIALTTRSSSDFLPLLPRHRSHPGLGSAPGEYYEKPPSDNKGSSQAFFGMLRHHKKLEKKK